MSGHLGKNFDVRMQNGAICHLNIKIWGTFENWGGKLKLGAGPSVLCSVDLRRSDIQSHTYIQKHGLPSINRKDLT